MLFYVCSNAESFAQLYKMRHLSVLTHSGKYPVLRSRLTFSLALSKLHPAYKLSVVRVRVAISMATDAPFDVYLMHPNDCFAGLNCLC